MSQFSVNLKTCMDEQGIRPDALARELNVTESLVRMWLAGTKDPYPALRRAICNALDADEADLFGSASAPAKASEPQKPLATTPKPVEAAAETDAEPAASKSRPTEKTPAPVAKEESKRTPERKSFAEDAMPAPKDPPAKKEPAPAEKKASPAEATAKPKKEVKPAEASSKDKLLAVMKETKRNPKAVTKTMPVDAAKAWVEDFVAATLAEVTRSVTSLGEIAKAEVPLAFADIPATDEKYAELIKAASGASEEGLAMALAILKKFKK